MACRARTKLLAVVAALLASCSAGVLCVLAYPQATASSCCQRFSKPQLRVCRLRGGSAVPRAARPQGCGDCGWCGKRSSSWPGRPALVLPLPVSDWCQCAWSVVVPMRLGEHSPCGVRPVGLIRVARHLVTTMCHVGRQRRAGASPAADAAMVWIVPRRRGSAGRSCFTLHACTTALHIGRERRSPPGQLI
jgi:hypothetical protein